MNKQDWEQAFDDLGGKTLKELKESELPSFVDHLREAHARQYRGTDDDMADDFEVWVCGDSELLMEEAKKWGKLLVERLK